MNKSIIKKIRKKCLNELYNINTSNIKNNKIIREAFIHGLVNTHLLDIFDKEIKAVVKDLSKLVKNKK